MKQLMSTAVVLPPQVNALADTSAVVTATISDGDMATLAGLSETGNAYTITITDTSVAAAALILLMVKLRLLLIPQL